MSRRTLLGWYAGRYGGCNAPERIGIRSWPGDRALAEFGGRLALALDFIERTRLSALARAVEARASEFAVADNDALRSHAVRLRVSLIREGVSDQLAVQAFAVIREMSQRLLQKRHHRVQLMGGFGLLRGSLVEMATGEGKTLTALLPAITVALAGVPVHVITVNEYLARRDADYLRPVFSAFGLSVGLLTHAENDSQRREAYASDVLYAVNKDLVFDYLRDGIEQRELAAGVSYNPRQRGLFFAVIDEADSVLIDEARTPLIIARERVGSPDEHLFREALTLSAALKPHRHFSLDARHRSCRLTDSGRAVLEREADIRSLEWCHHRTRDEMVEQALNAHHLFRRGEQYVVQEGKVQIIDEFTGRILPDRTWERGLHQLIELKEGCRPTAARDTVAKLTYPQFFQRYVRIAGMTGTAAEVSGELKANYGIQVVRVPTHRPCIRRHFGTRVFTKAAHRWAYVADQAIRLAGAGRAVLIGTRSVEASEHLAGVLAGRRAAHVVLNALQDRHEAEIVAQAGMPGRITVATNMAGRGTDISVHPDVSGRGGLHVILTEFHESGRIDRQLFGRAARQGDPGSCEACGSLEDALFARNTGWLVRLLQMSYSSRIEIPGPLANLLRWLAQRAAERQYIAVRRYTVDRDDQISKALSFTGVRE